MAGPWLYAIAARAGLHFEIEGESIPVTVEKFLELVADGRIAKEPKWGGKNGIRSHWNDIEKGDELFIYSGDNDSGIIGYAKIADKTDDRYLVLDFNSVLDQCRALKPGNHSITAPVVREWRRFLLQNVIDLGPFENTLRALLPWSARSIKIKHLPGKPTNVRRGRT